MKNDDDDIEELLFFEDLLFPEEKTDDDVDDVDEDDDDDADDDDDNIDDDDDDDDVEDLAFVYSDPDRSSPTADPRPRTAPREKGRNTLSPAATRFVAGLVTAGIAFFLAVLFILICVLWK